MYLLKEQRRDANVKLERAQAKLVQFDQLNTQVGVRPKLDYSGDSSLLATTQGAPVHDLLSENV